MIRRIIFVSIKLDKKTGVASGTGFQAWAGSEPPDVAVGDYILFCDIEFFDIELFDIPLPDIELPDIELLDIPPELDMELPDIELLDIESLDELLLDIPFFELSELSELLPQAASPTVSRAAAVTSINLFIVSAFLEFAVLNVRANQHARRLGSQF